ncbi:DUF2163 domain-containing protein [Hyphomicrobium sp.]|uniref:DUF2163 domain-containing protein n=1 Tax=Hyphomicrobium sp. TaxID=82 RepID=UPI001DC02701|nr:DUF2163 domain-containing protein [Hyphomicrobium sp.]MBY0560016.1 DUF2163 domain-containing protein [Hyphomicrobium sp.]
MKRISPQIFDELRSKSSNIVVGWLVERGDGLKLGFTTADTEFTFEGVAYSPTNPFSTSSVQSKNNFSVDNVNTVALMNEQITKGDLLGGRWDNAKVKFFWIRPDKPEWGVVPIRGGKFGTITTKGQTFETELRSVLQTLQQPFGDFYTLECSADLGDAKCKVKLDPPKWAAGQVYVAKIDQEAGIGDIVKPTTPNGFWYVCTNAPNTVKSSVNKGEVSNQIYDKLLGIKKANGLK